MSDVKVGDRFQSDSTEPVFEIAAVSDSGDQVWVKRHFEDGRVSHFTEHTSTFLSSHWNRVVPFFVVGARYEWKDQPSPDFRYECLRVEEFDGTRYATLKRNSRGETRVMMFGEELFGNFQEI